MLLDEEWNRGDTGLRARSEPGCRAGRSGRGIRRDGGHPSGSAPAGGDPARGAGQEYTANDYHAVSDEVKPDWDLSGAVEDLTFLYHLGARLAATDEWPAWSPTSEFRAVRERERPAEQAGRGPAGRPG